MHHFYQYSGTFLNTILFVLSPGKKSRDLPQDQPDNEADIEEDSEEDIEEDNEEDDQEDGADDTEFLSKEHPLFKSSRRRRVSQLPPAMQSRDNDATFRIYQPGTKDRLHITVTRYNKEPSATELKKNTNGEYIYIISALPDSPPEYSRYIKIGKSNDPETREIQLQDCLPMCFRGNTSEKRPRTSDEKLWTSEKTQWIMQIEDLVKEDLREFRRLREKCWDSNCETQHSEWFEYDRQKAIDAVNYWIGWLKKFNPYESDGSLKLRYVRELFNTDISFKNDPKTSPAFLFDSQGRCWVDHSQMEKKKKNKKNKKKEEEEEEEVESSLGQHAKRRISATGPRPTEPSATAHLALVRRPDSSPSGLSALFESSLQVPEPIDVGSRPEPRRPRNSLNGSTRTPKSAAGKLKAQHRLSPSVQNPPSSKSVPNARSRASSAMQASKSDSNLAPVSGPGVTTGGRSVSDSAIRHVPSKGGRRTSERLEQRSRHDSADDSILPQRVSSAPKPRGNKAGKYHALQAEAPFSVHGSGSENEDNQSDPQTNDEQDETVSEDENDHDQPIQSKQEEDDGERAWIKARPYEMYESDEDSERNRHNVPPTPTKKPEQRRPSLPRKEFILDEDEDTTMIDPDLKEDTPADSSPVHEKDDPEWKAQDEQDTTALEDDLGDDGEKEPQKDPPSSPLIAYPSRPKDEDNDIDVEAADQDTPSQTAKSKSKYRPTSARKSNKPTPRKATNRRLITPTTRQTRSAPAAANTDPKPTTTTNTIISFPSPARARAYTASSTRTTKRTPKRGSLRYSNIAKVFDTDGRSTMETVQAIVTPRLTTQPKSSSLLLTRTSTDEVEGPLSIIKLAVENRRAKCPHMKEMLN